MRSAGFSFAAFAATSVIAISACGSHTTPASSDPPVDDVHYRWAVGDCLLIESRDALPHEPFGQSGVVDCERQHTFEVFFAGDIEAGEDDPYPDDLALESWEICAAVFHDYVGAHLSETSLGIVVYLPDRTEWAGGLRYRACLLEDPGAGGDPSLVAGSLSGASDRVPSTVAAGQCFATRSILGPTVPAMSPISRRQSDGSHIPRRAVSHGRVRRRLV